MFDIGDFDHIPFRDPPRCHALSKSFKSSDPVHVLYLFGSAYCILYLPFVLGKHGRHSSKIKKSLRDHSRRGTKVPVTTFLRFKQSAGLKKKNENQPEDCSRVGELLGADACILTLLETAPMNASRLKMFLKQLFSVYAHIFSEYVK